MTFINNYLVSQEAIGFVKNEALYKDLVTAVAVFRGGELTNDALSKSGIVQAVMRHTNIPLVPQIVNSNAINASVIPPSIDKNHPLSVFLSKLSTKEEGRLEWHGQMILKHVKDKVGYVDLKTSKVHGVYAKLGCHLLIHKGLLANNISDEEVAAILLHELGHIFTYYEYLGTVVTTNYALATTALACTQASDVDRRIEIIGDTTNALDLDINVRDLATSTDPEAIQVVLGNAYIAKKRSDLGSDIYDLTSWEFLSDQFAVRHGAGRALVSILDRAQRGHGHDAYRSNATYLAMEALKGAVYIATNVFTMGLSSLFYILVGVFYNPLANLYDKPKERFVRIKEQIIEALKDRTITKERRASLLADIDAIEQIEQSMSSRRTLFQFIFTSVIPVHRKQWKQSVLQKELEALANNPLFVSAAKLHQSIS